MKNRLLMLTAIALISTGTNVFGEDSPRQPSRSREWLDRPWEIRYVLFVGDLSGINSTIRAGRKINETPDRPGREKVYLFADEMFEPSATYDVPGKEPLAMVLMQFDSTGHVMSKSNRLSTYTAKRNMLDDLVLVRTNSPAEKPYYFADWSQGIPGDVSFSPAICAGDDDRRYESDWKAGTYIGSFGCREWTAQLYDNERPYIDVTSYAKHGSFIGEFVGWSRFTDPPKPVIGLHGKRWLCLHDCPAGETPGLIPSIKAWVAKHHFPMPERPTKQPLYPNSNYKDDLSE